MDDGFRDRRDLQPEGGASQPEGEGRGGCDGVSDDVAWTEEDLLSGGEVEVVRLARGGKGRQSTAGEVGGAPVSYAKAALNAGRGLEGVARPGEKGSAVGNNPVCCTV